ncbi:MAG TPA: DUF3137 domain-containing protein [Actinomycetota bacterium]|nr:DUF3137 domain-containing protein [Actinomycetota bacterium]
MGGSLLVLLLIALVIVGGILHYRQKRHRQLGIVATATKFGFQYSNYDVLGLVSRPFELFRRGDDRGCENIIWGNWGGVPVIAGDYWYYEENQDSDGGNSKTYYRFTVGVIDVNATFPRCHIRRENLLTRLADHLSFHDLTFESEQFNKTFQVEADDKKFAFELIDPLFMHWLLSTDHRFNFQTCGTGLLVYSKPLKPTEFVMTIGFAKEMHARIPHLVWEKYSGVATPPLPTAAQTPAASPSPGPAVPTTPAMPTMPGAPITLGGVHVQHPPQRSGSAYPGSLDPPGSPSEGMTG